MKPVHPQSPTLPPALPPTLSPAVPPPLPLPSPQSALRLARLQAFVLRCPIETPVRTSFGTMHERPAVLVRAEDADGSVGWGEIWCNFPACGAEHRGRLLDTVLAPLLIGQAFASPPDAYRHCTQRTAVLALQAGEPGPIAQTIAGVDLALWDLWARRAGLPLYRLLGARRDSVPVYASGINPERPEDVVAASHAQGYRDFKLKIGFDPARDLDNIGRLRAMLGVGEALMVDANQAWGIQAASAMLPRLEPFGLGWLEEPLRADSPIEDWRQLHALTKIPLAAGENLIGETAFAAAIDSKVLSVVQPDLAKWGGISGTWPVIQRIAGAGLRYCPHFLGAGVGLLASAHVLAAAGGDGMLEVDANANLLRTALAPGLTHVVNGCVPLGTYSGIGVEPDGMDLRDVVAAYAA